MNTYVRQIRAALGERAGEDRYLKTYPGRGYRFLPVTVVVDPSEADAVVGSVAARPPVDRGGRGSENPWVEIPVCTHLSSRGERGLEAGSRNHLVVLTADVVVAMPGGSGTCSEVELALRYGRPVIAHLEGREEIPGLPSGVSMVPSLEEVLALVRDRLSGDRM